MYATGVHYIYIIYYIMWLHKPATVCIIYILYTQLNLIILLLWYGNIVGWIHGEIQQVLPEYLAINSH